MEQEIQEIIKKNLPAQVGEILQKRLEQAESDYRSLQNLKEKMLSLDEQIIRLNEEISKYKAFDSRNSLLEIREKLVSEQERNLKIETLEFQLQAEKEKTQFSKDVALGLVRNTEYKRSFMDNKTVPEGMDQYGNQRYATHTLISEETKLAK